MHVQNGGRVRSEGGGEDQHTETREKEQTPEERPDTHDYDLLPFVEAQFFSSSTIDREDEDKRYLIVPGVSTLA